MAAMFEKSRTQSDFTAQKIAREAGVSVVLFYRLVGEKFKELRAQLDGPRRDFIVLKITLFVVNKTYFQYYLPCISFENIG